jgi:capsular polysaccharide biosynthesis protein
MGSEIIMALVGVLCTAISSAVTFFLTRRKYNTDVDS